MAEFEELDFIIPAFAPTTMPLPRLIKYLEQIAAVVGTPDDMHLLRVDEGSTKPVFNVPHAVRVRAKEQGAELARGRGTVAQRTAYDRIRRMVQKDGGQRAKLTDRTGAILIDFPELEQVSGDVLGVRQSTTIDGMLQRIGGDGDNVPLQIQDLAGVTLSGFHAPKALAKEMGKFLFEPLRLSGIGIWDRPVSGQWRLAKMQVQTFDPLDDDDDDLERIFATMKAAPVVWPQDADARLLAEREGSE